jgi:hypothetical protein
MLHLLPMIVIHMLRQCLIGDGTFLNLAMAEPRRLFQDVSQCLGDVGGSP